MDLAALCDIYRAGNGPNGCHLAVFSVDIAFPFHFMVTHPPPPAHLVGVLVVLATQVKNCLKWQVIQMAIHLIVV